MLQTRQLAESHTAENLANVLKNCFSEWGISDRYIVGVTDNARNIVNAWNDQLEKPNIPCVAHTLNLAVGRVLKLGSVANILGHVRNLVSQFHYSTTLAAKLRAKQSLLKMSQHKLINDCPTRWNSSYDMLSRVLEQQLAICAVLIETPSKANFSLDTKQVKTMEELCGLLKPLKDLTVKLSGQTYCTSSMVLPSIQKLLSVHLAEGQTDSKLLKECKLALHSDLKKRYQDPMVRKHLLAASFLDPRFRQLTFVSSEERDDTKLFIQAESVGCEKRSNLLGASEPVVQVKNEPSNVPSTSQSHPDEAVLPDDSTQFVPVKRELVDDPDLPTEHEIKRLQIGESEFDIDDVICCGAEMGVNNSPAERAKNEMDRYLSEPLNIESLKDKNFCVYKWWSSHEPSYPMLSRVARGFLCIPATSTPSERVFSLAGNIVTKKRCLLLPQNVDKLIFLNMNGDFLN